jgi:kynureninase
LLSPDISAAGARLLDAADALAPFQSEFHRPRGHAARDLVYLSGHSLGLQPKSAAAYVEQELADWRQLAVLGHHAAGRPWIGYHEHAAAGLAELTGAAAGEVVAMNSLTVNLHLMMVSFYRPARERQCILMERSAFPSDRYAVVSQIDYHGLDPARALIEVEPRAGEEWLRTEDLLDRIERDGPRLALVLLPGVQFMSGQSFALAPIIAAARKAGAAVGLDLAHSIGNTPLNLHDWNPDFGVWCSYKYLNAGPGAVGGCFVHERHAGRFDLPRFGGWWGHDQAARFRMDPVFRPMPGAAGWQISNPPILSTAPLLASLEIFRRAGPLRLRAKSVALTSYLQRCIEGLAGGQVEIITPADPDARGCQLSLRIKRPAAEARRCHERLTAAGVIGDWREPDVLRLAPAPLYNSFLDAYSAAAALADALRS